MQWKKEKKELTDKIAGLEEDIKVLVSGKKPTRPWTKKDNVQRPWRRDMFKLKAQHAGFTPRFANPDRVETLLDRGYKLANPDDYVGLTDRLIDDGSRLGKRITRHGMILMEIPNELKEKNEADKQEYRKQMSRRAKQDVKDAASEVGRDIGHNVAVHGD